MPLGEEDVFPMKYFRLTVFAIFFIFAGCSTSAINNSTMPDNDVSGLDVSGFVVSGLVVSGHPCLDVSGHPCPETPSNRTILAIGTIELYPNTSVVSGDPSPETLIAAFIPDREAAAHWNVTPMLMPPNCNDCVSIQVLEFKPAQKYVKLKIALKNPTGLTGYDVRGIAVVPAMDVRLLNADGWTELWDDGGEVARNPFKAFATNWPERQIEPGTAHARVYEFTYSKFANLATGTKLVVDASWPGHCQEAYAFDGVHQTGWVDANTLTADFSVSLTPQDWQGNISTLLIDLSEIGGGIEPMVHSGNDWQYSFNGPASVPDAPRANIWTEVVDSVTPIRAFWLFEIGIVKETPSLPIPSGINAAPGEVYVDLTWDAISNPDVMGINIYRRGKGQDYNHGTPLNLVPIKTVLLKDLYVVRNKMYYYILRAAGTDGALGPISKEVGAKPFEWGEQFRLSDKDNTDSGSPSVAVGSDSLSRVIWRDVRAGPVESQFQYFDILEENHTPDISVFPEYPGHSSAGRFYVAIGDNNIPYIYGAGFIGGDWDLIIHHLDENFIPNEDFAHFHEDGPVTSPHCGCVGDDGTFWVAYWDQVYPVYSGVYIRSLNAQGVLSDPILISPVSPDQYLGASFVAGLVCDIYDELHCAFEVILNDGANTIQLLYTHTIGGIWQTPEQATHIKKWGSTNWQRLDVDSQGKPYLVYASGIEAPLIEFIYRDAGAWSDVIDIFPEYPTCSSLQITIDDDDNINLFASPYGEPYEIGFRRGYNGSWSPTYEASYGFIPGNIGIMGFLISADCSPYGAVALVWEQGGKDIYAHRMLE